MAIIRLEEQTGYKDWLKNTNSSWQYDASIQATTDENPFIYLTNTGENDAVFQIALSKLVDIQLIRKNSVLVTPFILDKAKGIKVELRDQSQNVLATSKVSLNSKTWIHLLANTENITLDITELWITFVLPAEASTVIAGIQGQILTQDQTVVDSMKVEATDGDTAIDLTQAKLNASKYFVKFAPESWWRADGVLKAKQLLTVDPLDITVNVAEAMNKTFYVDAVNGDDNNDGSESAPFKTLQKAVDSVPVGGRVVINLKSNYEVLDHNETIQIYSKHVFINLNGYILKTGIDSSGTYNELRLRFFNKASLLSFFLTGNSQIILSDEGYDSSKSWNSYRYRFVVCSSEFDLKDIGRSQLDILAVNMNTGVPFLVINKGVLIGYVGGSGEYTVDGFNINIVAQFGESKAIIDDKLIQMTAPVNFHWRVDNVVDSNGDSVDVKDKVDGIIKDANGVPRNIVSNIVF